MVHKNYKGLATKTEAEKWFNIQPPPVGEKVIAMPALSGNLAHGRTG